MDWLDVNGAALRYDLSGQGTETVVLVHELGGALESWDDVVPPLGREFRVLRYDQRGFGLSEKMRGTLDVDDMADDIAGLLTGLGIGGPCHMVGTAMGAGIAVNMTLRHPDRVARLVLTSPATGTSGDRRAQLQERAEMVEKGGMRIAAEASLARSYPENLRGDRARFETYRCRWIANDPFGFAAINRMLGEMDLNSRFGEIGCETLVIAGEHDLVRPAAAIEKIAGAIPNARYVLADTGHFMAVQTPELFLELVTPFLKGA
jgi:3-oxoadipate enol-lactonase